MEKNEKDFESGVEFNQEKEPLGKNLRFYYNGDDGTVTAITLETKDGDVDLFPVPIQLPNQEEIFNYTPNLTVINPENIPEQQDERGPYFYPDFTDLEYRLNAKLESEGYDRSFLDFLAQYLPEEEYMRFVIEQTAVKIHLLKTKTRDILPPSIYNEDKKRLLFEWPFYYPEGEELGIDSLPIASQYEYVYLVNKAIVICRDPELYNFKGSHFDLDEIKKIAAPRNSIEEELVKELYKYQNVSLKESKDIRDFINTTGWVVQFNHEAREFFDWYFNKYT